MTDKPPNTSQRPPKKSEMLEVRLDYETKRNFLNACRRAGRTASDVVRESVLAFIARESARPDVQPEPGKLIAMIPRPIRRKRYLVAGASAAAVAGVTMLAALPSAADPDAMTVFHKFDLNGDGVLTPDEFFGGELKPEAIAETRQSLRAGRPAPDPNAMRIFNEAYVTLYPRADGDPKGQWRYIIHLSGSWENAPDDFDPASIDFLRMAEVNPFAAEFIDIDVDGDDKVSSAEFETWFNRLLAKSFDRMDRDRDGYLVEAEFLRSTGWLSETAEDGSEISFPRERMQAAFGKLDKDADGRLSLAEYMLK